MKGQSQPSCQVCSVYYPNARIVKCQKLTPGGMTMCSSCHRRFHPSCASHVSAVRRDDMKCDQCLLHQAVYTCPQCYTERKILQLCEQCETVRHSDLYLTHRDHLRPIAS